MSSGPRHDDEHNGDDDGQDKSDYHIHQGVIFAIHLTPTIYKTLPTILELLSKSIKKLARSMPNTGFGCYLLNCVATSTGEETTTPASSSYGTRTGIHPIFKLDDINADQLKILDDLLTQTNRKDILTSEYSRSFSDLFQLLCDDPVENCGEQLSSMLNQCHDDFTYTPKFVKPYSSKKIYLFTDCDKPFNGNTSTRITLDNIVKDLNESKITVVPMFLEPAPGKKFDRSEYSNLLETEDSSDMKDYRYQQNFGDLSPEMLVDKLSKVGEAKRTAFACTLTLKNLSMSIKGYSMFSEVKVRNASDVYDNNGKYQYVEKKTVKVVEHTGEVVNPDQLTKVVKFGDQYLPLDKPTMETLYQFNEPEIPCLHIICFRQLEYFNPSYSMGTPTFVVPDEDGPITHSRRTFSALYQSLTKKKKMALVWGIQKKASHPSFFYLIPTDESLGYKTTTKNYPQGLAMIQIPSKDYIRCLPEYITEQHIKPSPQITPNLYDYLLPELIQDFTSYDNPQLDWIYKIFEDYLLQKEIIKRSDSDLPEAVEKQLRINNQDTLKNACMELRNTIQSKPEISKVASSIKNEINKISNFEGKNDVSSTSSSVAKKQKGLTDELVLKAFKLDQLKMFSADQLKTYIKSKPGLIQMGRTKGEMIQRINEFLEQRVE
ncbi:hypothetical protein CANARDRAFT_54892 [[Candida] arabinofermentans NRRL YB-2248]|uniref:DNA helicase n=1 Tax=[Candida] arabinofermentans NRRL YB-2248 TaxID=983967 RepID=A0A1E4T8H7_9ASCO|nr:hypothetical protein CANARDRAFT_54892 [[Candida] arabinofermentans NRRL YB-2248]